MPAPVDPWTAFLQWLQTIIIPDWGGLIALLPILIILGVIGPALSLMPSGQISPIYADSLKRWLAAHA